MAVPRIYQSGTLHAQTTVWLTENAAHHLARVLRAAIGGHLIVFNGDGGEYPAVITQITKKGVEVRLGEFADHERESPIRIELAQGIARGEKMDFIIQKAVELGVNRVTPLLTERGNVRLTGEREIKRHQHWQSVAVSACEQCGRNRVPAVVVSAALENWLPTAKADYRFVLSPHVNEKLPAQLSVNASVILLIGPEGGLSDTEVASAVAAGFQPLSLGPRVLRTETAALAAITTLQCRYGDFS